MTDPKPLVGILLMLGAVMCFAALDATAKHLSQTFPVPMLVWSRYTLHFVLMVIFLAPSMRGRLIVTQRPSLQIMRAVMLVGTTGFAIAGFRIMPLAESTALLFITPLVVAVMAHWVLKEAITPGRWLAVLLGFAGALLIARPGGALSMDGIVLMSLAAACYSIYQIQTKQLAATENTMTMLFYTALIGTITMTLATPWYWGGPTPDAMQGLLIASLGIHGGVGHLLLTRAFRHAPASTLSPFLYAQLIWATLFGWIFHAHLPDALSFVGMTIIALSSASIALGERFRSRHAAEAEPIGADEVQQIRTATIKSAQH